MEKSSDSSSSNSSNWASLPDDLISLIIEKIVHVSEFIRFSVVCKSWNSISSYHRMQKLNQLSNHQLPWLFTGYRDEKVPRLCNYTPNSNPTIFNFKLRISSEYIAMMYHCVGSSHGWLIFVKKLVVTLLNPLSGNIIHLPRLIDRSRHISRRHTYPSNDYYGFTSVILSRDPSLGSFEVLIFGCYYVAHLKLGDKFWAFLKRSILYSSFPKSLIFHKDRIVGACEYGGIMCLDVIIGIKDSRRIELREIIPKCDIYIGDCFLSETTLGDLLIVYRYRYTNCGKFKVSKLVESDGQLPRLVPVDNLHGHSIFLNFLHNQSISVLASNYVGYCRPNSIYYQYRGRPSILTPSGVEIEESNLEDRSCQKHPIPIPVELFWILPSMTLPPPKV